MQVELPISALLLLIDGFQEIAVPVDDPAELRADVADQEMQERESEPRERRELHSSRNPPEAVVEAVALHQTGIERHQHLSHACASRQGDRDHIHLVNQPDDDGDAEAEGEEADETADGDADDAPRQLGMNGTANAPRGIPTASDAGNDG